MKTKLDRMYSVIGLMVVSIMLSVAVFTPTASAQEATVERLSYDSDTGNFVDQWVLPQDSVQSLDNGFIVTSDSDQARVACHARIDAIEYIWSESPIVISPSGQSISLSSDQRLRILSDSLSFSIEPNDNLCDSLVALFGRGAGATIAGINTNALLIGTGVFIAALAISDNNDRPADVVSPPPNPGTTPAPTPPTPTTPTPDPDENASVTVDTFRLPLAITRPRTPRTLSGNIALNDNVPAGTRYFLQTGTGPFRLGPGGEFRLDQDGRFFYRTGSCSGRGQDTFVAVAITPSGTRLLQRVTIIHTGALDPASPICGAMN